MAVIPPDAGLAATRRLPGMGIIVLELYWQQAPNTCRNSAELARRGYYTGTKFHRIIKDFMIQGDRPTAQVEVVHLFMANSLKMNFIQT